MNKHKTPEESAITDETYTPPWLFEALGIQFDLDVASPVEALNWTIPAIHRYTIEDDALSQPWYGKVWMNPPYSKPTPWVDRFIEHNNGVALLPFAKSHWFGKMWVSQATMAWPLDGQRLFSFVTREGKPKSIFMPTCLFALGAECQEALQKLGRTR